MYARSTTIHGKADNIDAGLRFVETEVRPTLDGLTGCLGMSCLVDRGSGQTIVTSSWLTEQDMLASDDQLRAIRERGREILGGPLQIDEWEIGVMHRTDHGSCCRVTWAQGDVDKLLGVFKESALPAFEQIEGFCSASLLINRSSSMACGTTTFDTHAHMVAARDAANDIRTRTAAQGGMEILDVREFDLVHAHLHVPEMV